MVVNTIKEVGEVRNGVAVRKLWIVLGLLLSVGCGGMAWGQTKKLESLGIQLPELRRPSGEVNPIQRRIREWFRLWRQKRYQSAISSFKEIHKLQKDLAVNNLFLFSSALVLQADERWNQGNTKQAQQLYQWAQTFSPTYARPYFRLGWFSLYNQWTKPHIGAIFVWKGVVATVRSPVEAAAPLVALARFLGWLFGIAFLCLWISLLLRCLRSLLSDLRNMFPQGVTPFQMSLMSLLLLLLPPLMGAGILETLLFWILFSWFYQSNSERVLTTLGLLLLSGLPFVAGYVGKFVSFAQSPLQQMYTLNQSADRAQAAPHLARIAEKKHPYRFEILSSLGLYYKRIGQLGRSRTYYQRALKLRSAASVRVNLGNLDFIEREPEKAYQHYLKGASTPEGQFNLSQLLKHSASTAPNIVQQKVDASQAALRSGGARVERFEQGQTQQINRYIMDAEVPLSLYWKLFLQTPDRTRLSERIWQTLSAWIPIAFAPFTGIAFVVLLWLLLPVLGRVFQGRACSQCGSVYQRLEAGSNPRTLCSQCRQLDEKKEGLSPARRVQKELEIQRYQRLRYYAQVVLAVVMMGSVQVIRNKTWKGFFYFLALAITGFLWLFPEAFLSHSLSVGTSRYWWLTIGFTGWTVLLYYFSLREALTD